MKQLFKITFISLFLLAFTFSVFAQSPSEIEQNLVSLYGKVNENSAYKSDTDYDLLEKANEHFKTKLLNYTKIASVPWMIY